MSIAVVHAVCPRTNSTLYSSIWSRLSRFIGQVVGLGKMKKSLENINK